VRVWDLGAGRLLHTLEGHTDRVWAVAVAGDGRAVSGADDETVRVWDLGAGRCLTVFPCEATVQSVAVTPDHIPTVVAGLGDGQVQFFRLEEG
jgi:WD40 repeat protein